MASSSVIAIPSSPTISHHHRHHHPDSEESAAAAAEENNRRLATITITTATLQLRRSPHLIKSSVAQSLLWDYTRSVQPIVLTALAPLEPHRHKKMAVATGSASRHRRALPPATLPPIVVPNNGASSGGGGSGTSTDSPTPVATSPRRRAISTIPSDIVSGVGAGNERPPSPAGPIRGRRTVAPRLVKQGRMMTLALLEHHRPHSRTTVDGESSEPQSPDVPSSSGDAYYSLDSPTHRLGRRLLGTHMRSHSCAAEMSMETVAVTALPIDCWLRERLKNWVQLSGHEGFIVPASSNTLYKKQAPGKSEAHAYEAITKDRVLDGFTPKYYRTIDKNDESFIEIEDLLSNFPEPSKSAMMDVKMGTRTFLESEAGTQPRKDLYEKMIGLDPSEATEEERVTGAITKQRYMQFREKHSSSAQLGFRIEAARTRTGKLEKNFKKIRTRSDVADTLNDFFCDASDSVRQQVVARLRAMREAVEKSQFFATHEVVGSSLLFVYNDDKANVWQIDFAKSQPLESHQRVDHRTAWVSGNREDGYLTGLDNLISILEDSRPLNDR